jgi:hypothetical protein
MEGIGDRSFGGSAGGLIERGAASVGHNRLAIIGVIYTRAAT